MLGDHKESLICAWSWLNRAIIFLSIPEVVNAPAAVELFPVRAFEIDENLF